MSVTQNHPARQMNTLQRKAIALQAISGNHHITELAQANQINRRFIHQQKDKAIPIANENANIACNF